MGVDPASVSEQSGETVEYLPVFAQLSRSFRRQVYELYRKKTEHILNRAELKVRLVIPAFDRQALQDETAHGVLDLIDEAVKEASLLKRPALRRAAIALISNLYGKHYEMLMDHHLIDKVEELYYRLRS
jgi:hypothetical protein